MQTTLRDMRQQHNKIVTRIRALNKIEDDRELKEDESKELETLYKEGEELKSKIEKRDRLKSIELERASDEIPKSEKRKYQFSNAIKCLVARHSNKAMPGCYEKEVSEELEKRGEFSGSGVIVPVEEFFKKRMEKRTVTSADTALISEPLKPDEYLPGLYEMGLLSSLGMKQVMAQNKFKFPTSNNISSGFVGGDGADALGEQDPSFTNNEVEAHFLGAYAAYSMKLLKSMDNNLSIENLLRQSLASGIAEKLDETIVKGTGVGVVPSGITVLATNETSKDRSASAAWVLGDVLGLIESLRKNYKNNAMALKFLMSTTVWKSWSETVAFTDTSKTLLDVCRENGQVIVTNHLNQPDPATAEAGEVEAVIGDFSQFMITMFGGVEMKTVEVSDDALKLVERIVAVLPMDLTLLRNEAFQKLKVDRKA